ncbi:MAG: hypothetical protein FWB74_03625 [Defluviitaleaceae bacterium]|nr:hypothetical protein [Defluviitaleaceae bacterium]
MSNRNAPGRSLLRTSGILYIVTGFWGLLVGTLAMLGVAWFGADVADVAGAEVAGTVLGAVFAVGLVEVIVAAWRLFVGFMGFRNADNLDKAKMLRILIIVALVVNTISIVTSFIGGVIPWWGLAYLILAVTYFMGAQRNINA